MDKTVPIRKPKVRKAKGNEVLKEGGVLLPPNGVLSFFSSWRNKRLVLQGGKLSFYSLKDANKAPYVINMADVQTCGRTSDKEKDFVLSMDVVLGLKTISQVVAFETNEDLDEWISIIEGNAPRMLSSVPTSFKHKQHLDVSGGELKGLPDEWKTLLGNSDITKSDYDKNKEAVEKAVEYYSDAVKGSEEKKHDLIEELAGDPEFEEMLEANTKKGSPWDVYEKGSEYSKPLLGCVFEVTNKENKTCLLAKEIMIRKQDERKAIVEEMKHLLEKRHTNITNLIDAYLDDESLWLIIERPLKECLGNIVPEVEMQDHEIAAIGKAVSDAIAHIHSMGIVHKNINVKNIHFNDDYEIKLADFGMCLKINDDQEDAKKTAPYWMAPEIIKKEEVTGIADIWSFGILIMEMLDGAPPYEDEETLKVLYKITSEDPPKSAVEGSEIVEEVIEGCLVKEVSNRINLEELQKKELFSDLATKEELKALVDGEE